MPLVVPILRLSMLFLNVFETFKTMKPPTASARRGGQPSVRAITQRKRNMKGCLAVWIVWVGYHFSLTGLRVRANSTCLQCCLTAYERLFEGLVCYLVPFYSEIKSIVLLFLLVTRARVCVIYPWPYIQYMLNYNREQSRSICILFGRWLSHMSQPSTHCLISRVCSAMYSSVSLLFPFDTLNHG
jgi:hypothetical protein